MNEKILAAIEETLPQMQVDAIRKALTELDGLRERAKALEADSKADYERDRKQRTEIAELEAQVNDLTSRLQAATTERNAYKESLQRATENALRAELAATNNTMDKFLKNTVYREKLQHQVANEYTTVSTQYVNGQQVAVPTPGKTYQQVEDTKTTETE